MADYTVGSVEFVQDGSGSALSYNYNGRPQGYRGLCTRQRITLNKRCKIASFVYGGYFQGAYSKTYRCVINQNSGWYSSAIATGSCSLSGNNLQVGTLTCTFNAELNEGTYYVWVYFTDSNYGAIGNASNPFAYRSSSIVVLFPTMFTNDNGIVKQVRGMFANDNGTIKAIKAVLVNDHGTIKKL